MDLNTPIQFLKHLKVNNNKDWFEENRKTYETSRKIFLELSQSLIDGISKFDPELEGIESKKCIYRINRDIRFSKDKTPYKTNFGSHFGRDAKKTVGTGYYIHISPGENFIGGGIYMPQPEMLAAIRQEIDYNPDQLIRLIESSDFKNNFGEVRGEALKTAPKGYPKDHPNIELLRLKSFYVLKSFTDEELVDDSFIDTAVAIYQEVKKFNDYLQMAID
ncbi:DUF2461 domain-containing protein [Reichenbachiella versicolor]|uniref:DUF2461 domain-containing protein n=1 Tax=Reichenbachiella versicolor TaxID=1821036 RepID=UPI000D6E3870|nr:DUF2461 domain-containing protein [Reichenbachiella versicolor]